MRFPLVGFPLLLLACAPFTVAVSDARPRAAELKTDRVMVALEEWRLEETQVIAARMGKGAEKAFLDGVLANRRGESTQSVELLERALPALMSDPSPRTAMALVALCDDYLKLSRFPQAERTAKLGLSQFAEQLTTSQRTVLVEAGETARILNGTRPSSVSWSGPLRVEMSKAPVGVWTIVPDRGGADAPWILDTGANYSVVSESTAKKLNLAVLDGASSTGTGTNLRVDTHYAVVPALTIGGATLHDLVVLVISDAALHVRAPRFEYQIEAILGYNAFKLLGQIAFDDSGFFSAGHEGLPQLGAGRLLLDGMGPVIVAAIDGQALPFHLDTGANITTLYAPYRRRFARRKGDWTRTNKSISGAGGAVAYDLLTQPEVSFDFAGTRTELRDVAIHADAHGRDPERMYGNVGVDLLNRFHRFTFDFDRMRYAVGPAVPFK